MRRAALLGVAVLILTFACAGRSAAAAIGDRLDPTGLVDQHTRPFRFAALAPHAVAIGFVTTRCRTGLCSLVTGKFAHLVAVADARRERLVLVAIDPAADTPAALERYGRLFSNDDRLTFVTGSAATVNALARGFGVTRAGGTVDTHGETVVLLDGDGRVADILGGADWSPATLQAALDAVARIAYNPLLRALVHLTWSAEAICGEHPVDSPLALHHAALVLFAALPVPFVAFALRRRALPKQRAHAV
jgi:cytochrome oxidase Cu insertion factor (SCO1/SenC/PrrC family)